MVDIEDQSQLSTDRDTDSEPAPESAQQPIRRSKSVARTFSVSVCLLLLLAMSVFWTITSYNTRELLQQQADRLGQALATQTAKQLTDLILANDLISVNVVLGDLIQDAPIDEITVLDVDGNFLSSVSSTRPSAQPWIALPGDLTPLTAVYLAPITLADSVAGQVRLSLDVSYIEVALINNLMLLSAATGVLLLLGSLLAWNYYQNLIGLPARLLAFSLRNIRHGDIQTCPQPKSNNEISSAIRQFNATAAFIEQHTFLGQLDALQIREEQEASLLTGKQDTTLLIILLSNFHYLASTINDEARLNLLNKYYYYAGKVSQLYNGEVVYCAEDEVIINFSAAQLEDEQAFYAVCAAQLFQQLLPDLGPVAGSDAVAKFRLGVHSGPRVSKLYSPITQSTSNLTGHTLDVAREIVRGCPDGSVLISDCAFQHAGAGTRIEADEYRAVGELEKTRTFVGLEPMSDYRLLLERQAGQLVKLYAA